MTDSANLNLPLFRDGEALTAGQLNQLTEAIRLLATMSNPEKAALLKEEYFELQQIYEDFDRRILTIKGWAITICIGGVGLGFEYIEHANVLLAMASFAAMLFWLIEAKWKTFQYANAYRIRKIEAYFRGDKQHLDITPLQIYHDWFEAYTKDAPVHEYEKEQLPRSPRQQAYQNALLSLVFTPYLHIIVVCAILAIVRQL